MSLFIGSIIPTALKGVKVFPVINDFGLSDSRDFDNAQLRTKSRQDNILILLHGTLGNCS